MAERTFPVDVLDISKLAYAERLTANSLQGLVNRQGPRLFLDYGVYDDPGTRKTNSVQMSDENWFNKYRQVLKRNDLDNLDYYKSIYPIKTSQIKSLDQVLEHNKGVIKGMVVWDPNLIESVNLALMFAGLKDLVVVHPEQV